MREPLRGVFGVAELLADPLMVLAGNGFEVAAARSASVCFAALAFGLDVASPVLKRIRSEQELGARCLGEVRAS